MGGLWGSSGNFAGRDGGWVLPWGYEPGIRCIWAERPLTWASYSPAAQNWTKAGALRLCGSTGPQTGQVTLEGLNGLKMKGRWLEEDYNMGKCGVKNRAF